METVWNDLFKELEKATERIKVLEDALLSISQNTCCWSCQEAAKVAMKALNGQVVSKQATLEAMEVKP
jgi:hypothetical protein